MDGSLFKKYADFIYEKTGIRFEETKNYFLTSKAMRRAEKAGVQGCEAYLDFITKGPHRHKEIEKFIDVITVHETFFYRNEPQLECFEKDVLTPLVARKKAEADKKIRIWSAACSTGDEVYTTIFQFVKNGWLNDIQLEIVGSDISHQSVNDAINGVYTEYSVRNVPPDLKEKYFKPEEERRYSLSADVKKLATFKAVNLKESSQTRALGKFDIVLCRNVLIYFDNQSKEQVLWNIYDALRDDGKLLVGHSENLYGFKHIFKADKDLNNAFAYTKAPPGTEKLHV